MVPPTNPEIIPTNTPIFKAGAPSTEVKYPFTSISFPNSVRVTAAGSARSALLTPKSAPVTTLIRINAITAANAPPAFSFAQEPPMATANKMCRLLITAQPMVSIVLPMVMTTPKSAPAICTSLPTLIINPAAGITAITVISTLPSFCKKSKLIRDFFFPAWLPETPPALSVPSPLSEPPFLAFRPPAFPPSPAERSPPDLPSEPESPPTAPAFPPTDVPVSVPVLSSPSHTSSTVIITDSPAFTAPSAAFMVRPSIPPQISTGVMVSTCFSFSPSKSASATRSPAFTRSPTFT